MARGGHAMRSQQSKPRASYRWQSGQALIESLIALLWLIPLWLALLFLSDLLAAQQTAISAVRHAVMLSHLSEGNIGKQEMTDIAQNRHSRESLDAPWMPRSLSLKMRLDHPQPLSSPKQLRELTQSTLAPARLITGGDFRLPTEDGFRAQAQWSFRLPEFLSPAEIKEPILLTEQLSVLQHGWASRSDDETRTRVIGMTVQSRLLAATNVFDVIRPVISLIEPAFDRFCPGRLDVDIVPADRTVGTQAGDARGRSC